ncbi:MAG: glutamate--tRNA ligase [Bacillota bacterium]|nr:glutamate--tRNA ligase [Bacillota bacterium]
MDYKELAQILFPEITKTPADYEQIFPKRNLPEGARVTRMAPSPTGFIHLGNLYGAMADERMAHTTNGVCYLRIEDTDDKREVEGAIPVLIDTLGYFGIKFDEGAMGEDETSAIGDYGPYWQSHRSEIYKACVKYLVEQGKAYPCFMSEEEIEAIRKDQESRKENPGIYGKYAKYRDASIEEVKKHLDAGEVPVMRFRSEGDPSKYFEVIDGIRGKLSMPENVQDVVILKQIGLPTYHFAHVVDDHFMRTTHVVRGEEWLSSLPIHVQLFDAMGWEYPVFCHNTVLMKIDEETGQKRKLSKRKDPELGLSYYKQMGYFPEAVREYLMTILNSDYEEWRIANPYADYNEFEFSPSKMSNSGTMFDLNKLNDVSKDVLAKKSAEEIYDFCLGWAKEYNEEKAANMMANKDLYLKIFDIDRGGEKPRKDLVYAEQIMKFISYFFDDEFVYENEMPEECKADLKTILEKYKASYDPSDDNSAWFAKLKAIAVELGYAEKPKDYKKNPDQFKGHVGHVSTVIRVAITGRTNSPDLWTIQQIMGQEMVARRIDKAMNA